MPFKTPNDLDDKYYDDFDDNKNFVQILFNPGKPVQARELTQLQSILQNQISKFSDHVFVDGAIVFGCKVNLFTYGFLRVKTGSIKNFNGAVLTDDFTNDSACRSIFFKKPTDSTGTVTNNNINLGTTFVPSTVTSGTTPYTARSAIKDLEDDFQIEIVDLIPKTDKDDLILVYKFIKGSTTHIKKFTSLTLQEVSKTSGGTVNPTLYAIDRGIVNGNPITFQIIDQIYTTTPNVNANLLVENINDLYTVNVTSGIVYKDGKFINVPESNVILNTTSETTGSSITTEYTLSLLWRNIGTISKTNTLGNNSGWGRKLFAYPYKSVGFLFTYNYVTILQDSSLGDNASSFTNATAPGADRLKFNIEIIQNNVDISDPVFPDNYTEIIRVRGGIIDVIKTNVEKQYSEILKLFAKRTYDESGSYTVRPFLLDMKEHLRVTYFKILFNGAFSVGNYPEIGDLIFPAADNTDSILTNYLIFNSVTETTNYHHSIYYSNRHIGEVTDVGTNYIVIKQLTELSWTSVISGSAISRKSPDDNTSSTGTVTQIVSTTLGLPEFLDGNNGIYTSFDTPVGNSDKFVISANSGRAYVQGFEYETSNVVNIDANKARGSDHLMKSVSQIDAPLENELIVKAGDNLFSINGYETNIVDINTDGGELKFLSTTDGLATGTIMEWIPFRSGVSINQNTNPALLSPFNKESVLFITSENAPL